MLPLIFHCFFRLPGVAKGLEAPASISDMYRRRKDVESDILSTHGDATNFFVTFLDNHDMRQRFYFSDLNDPNRFDRQATLGLACLFALQGIPVCTMVPRWDCMVPAIAILLCASAAGKSNAFDRSHPFYEALKKD